MFSSASDAPLARRPTDVALLVLTATALVVLSFTAPGPGPIDRAVSDVVKALPGLFGWFWEIAYDLLLGWTLVLVVIGATARRRKRLLLSQFLSGGLAYAVAMAAGGIAGTAWSDGVRSVTSANPPAVYPAMRVAIAAAVIAVSSPHLSRPLRNSGRLVIVTGALASTALGIALPSGIVAGAAAGLAAAAVVHLVLGSPGGRLSLPQVAAALDDLGVEATDLGYATVDPSGVSLISARSGDGGPLLVKVYGRDAWDGQLLTSMWSSLWNRGETPRFGGRLEQVEHEAFVTLLVERSGVPVLPVVAAGMANGRDALLVVETHEARLLDDLDPHEVGDALLARAWALNARLHDLGIAHGSLDGMHVVVLDDGTPALADLSDAIVSAPDAALAADRAQLLVSTALLVGDRRAVDAAHSALGNGPMAEMLPYLQTAALERATRRTLRERDRKLKDLRELAAEAAGVSPPKLEQLRRVTWSSLLMVAAIALVSYMVISAVANVGLSSLIAEFQGADAGWLVIALLLAPVIAVPQAVATIGSCVRPLRSAPVLMLQYSIQFIQLAVPSSAARIALEIRFFGKLGLSTAGAVAVGAIDSVCGFVVQVVLILAIVLSGLSTLDLSNANGTAPSISGEWLLVAVAAAVVLIAIALAVPKIRSFIKGKTAEVGDGLRVLRSPSKVLMIVGGNLLAQLTFAIILGVCLRAFGHRLALADLILTYNLVSLFAGFMPVPGGMGVAEAGYTAALVAFGVPHTAALSTAIAFRIFTYYLPPAWGGFAMRWLRSHDYI